MLNRNIAELSADFQRELFQHLRVQWATGYFELAVARTLQVLGAALEIEQATASGSRPDFLAHFADATITVEATSPVMEGSAAQVVGQRIPLLEILDEAAPAGWSVIVSEVPPLSENGSRKPFKTVVHRLLDGIQPPGKGAVQIDLQHDFPNGGRLRLRLLPEEHDRRIVMEPPLTIFDNTEGRVRRALDMKRSQVRDSTTPVLLAINGSGLATDLEGFDCALFGHGYQQLDQQHQTVGYGFKMDGEFTRKRDSTKQPTFAGVLAFVEVGLRRVLDPVLYLHPSFNGALPVAILELEQHVFSRDSDGVRVVEAKRRGVAASLQS